MARARSVDEIADELYAALPEEFIARRDDVVRAAKAANDRTTATAVAKWRKPSTSAWLANQLVRAHRDEVNALLHLGGALREAQSQLEGEQLRRLSAQRRKAVNGLVHQSRQLAARLGHPVGDDVGRQLEEILEAALASDDAAAQLRAGRLTTTLDRSGGFESATPRLQAVRGAGREGNKESAGAEHAGAQKAGAQKARKETEESERAAQARLEAAAAAAREANRELTQRTSEREALAAKVSALTSRISDLTNELDDLEQQVRTAKQQEQEAKRAVVQAERAARRANLAVEQAESHRR